jgi:hypothetical protein
MIVELLKPWSGWPVGHRFTEMTRGVFFELERRQIAKVVEKDEPRTATNDAHTNSGSNSRPGKRR